MYDFALIALLLTISLLLFFTYRHLKILTRLVKPNAFNSIKINRKENPKISSSNYVWLQEIIEEDMSIHATGTYKSLKAKGVMDFPNNDYEDYTKFCDITFIITCSDSPTAPSENWAGFIVAANKKFEKSPYINMTIQLSKEGYEAFKLLFDQIAITNRNPQELLDTGMDIELFVAGEIIEIGDSEAIGIKEIDQIKLKPHSEISVYDHIISRLPYYKTSFEKEHLLNCLNGRRNLN
ncbi:hypothetical protein [Methylotenera versatilis]|uniref:hypothetical protein n=1 Tax=Methylotenera versatilis TaxID=1055487 RepID=UPI000646034C|nr:hypothetical protein [Methylotenera versatilis]